MSAEVYPESSPEQGDPLRFFPDIEDWEALQGGKPRVFRNPANPIGRWIVLHVYDEHAEARKRFKSGAIIETLPPEDPTKIPTSRFSITRKGEYGRIVKRDVDIPSMMHLGAHGRPCEYRSVSSGGETYSRISSQSNYESFLKILKNDGMQELRYGIQDDQVKLIPVPTIRPARRLAA